MMYINNSIFKKIIIVFWALWWLIAVWTDIIGGFAHLGLVHASWAPDTNFPFLLSTLKMYSGNVWFAVVAFIGIIFWSLLSLLAFFWAAISLHKEKNIWFARAQTAFILSLTYWLAFFLADQLVMKFDLEQNHMVQGGFELLTFLAMYLLPDNDKSDS